MNSETKGYPAPAKTPREAMDLIRPYLEGQLALAEAAKVEAWAKQDPAYAEQIEKRRWLLKELGHAYDGHGISEGFEDAAQRKLRETASKPQLAVEGEPLEEDLAPAPAGFLDGLSQRFGAAPWWAISGAFHGLLILLLFLIGMAIMRAPKAETVILTSLEKQPEQIPPEKQPEREIFTNPVPVEMPEVAEQAPVVVHEEVEIAEHTETDDRAETHEAFGDEGISDIPLGGSGVSGAIGVGGGGAGAFGRPTGRGGRLARALKGGGGKATESAVDKALEWLARHQEKDGFWDTDKYLDNTSVRWGGGMAMFSKYDPGITGMALLAFLGAGHTRRVGKHKDVVAAGVEWLLKQQGPDGDFTAKVKPCHPAVTYYCHCIATLALAEALAMDGAARHQIDSYKAAQGQLEGLPGAVAKGVELILTWQKQNPSGGWTYYAPYQVTDVTVSGWAVMALKSAKIAGIEVPIESFQKASEAVKACTRIDKTKGDYGSADIGYLRAGSHQFNSKGYAITAAGSMIQVFVGADREESGAQAALELITQEDALPAWIFDNTADAHNDHQNLYYWYYGTLACFQSGGDHWKRWNDKMKAALLPKQRVGGPMDGSPQDVDGSWDPNDVWGAWGGRVYSTALGALCLEVYYRYLPLYR